MKILKFVLIFVIAFLFACVLIFTFIQPEFKVLASAKILTYVTPKIPIYFYVAGAFGIGLLLGLFAAFYYYFTQHRKVHETTKELHVLEERLAETRRTLEQYEAQQEEVHADDTLAPSYEEESVLLDEDDENDKNEDDKKNNVDAEEENDDSSGTLPADGEKDPV
jgi:hypothetical protein